MPAKVEVGDLGECSRCKKEQAVTVSRKEAFCK